MPGGMSFFIDVWIGGEFLLVALFLYSGYAFYFYSGNEFREIAASGLETVSRHGFAAPFVLTVPKSSAADRRLPLSVSICFLMVFHGLVLDRFCLVILVHLW